MRWLVGSLPIPVLVLLLLVGTTAGATPFAGVEVNTAAIPPLAQQLLPSIKDQLNRECPELPAVWLVAEVQAESSWDPHAFSSAGAAGLLQMLPGSWIEAGGGAGWTARPDPGHPVWDPATHLRLTIPWMCGHLRDMTAHLQATGKQISPLQALAVCHIAGCSRVTGSATGIPVAGEAGCGQGCVDQITAYLANIDKYVQLYAVPIALPPGTGATAAPYPGGPTGCTYSDPSGTGGCLTGAAVWMLTQTLTQYPDLPVSCWDRHAWNPTSDHPKGRACDFTIGTIGRFPNDALVARGWQIAEWHRANAGPLHIKYVIWQGRIWRAGDADWRVYSGGGIYNPNSPAGGHYDHIHVSTTD